jgi:hypothetical protein
MLWPRPLVPGNGSKECTWILMPIRPRIMRNATKSMLNTRWSGWADDRTRARGKNRRSAIEARPFLIAPIVFEGRGSSPPRPIATMTATTRRSRVSIASSMDVKGRALGCASVSGNAGVEAVTSSKAGRDCPLTASSGALDEMRLVCVACSSGLSPVYATTEPTGNSPANPLFRSLSFLINT